MAHLLEQGAIVTLAFPSAGDPSVIAGLPSSPQTISKVQPVQWPCSYMLLSTCFLVIIKLQPSCLSDCGICVCVKLWKQFCQTEHCCYKNNNDCAVWKQLLLLLYYYHHHHRYYYYYYYYYY